MQRISPAGALVGAVVVGLLAFLGGRAAGPFKGAAPEDFTPREVARDGGAKDAADAASDANPSQPDAADSADPGVLDAPRQVAYTGAGAFAHLLDGSPVPPLPAKTPKQVRFGVVLVSYEGAEGVAEHKSHRSRDAALQMAQGLVETAKEDFRAAVKQGDQGSLDDAGKMFLGILEPAAEYTLFTLPKGGVGGPVETPRGFWIVKRID